MAKNKRSPIPAKGALGKAKGKGKSPTIAGANSEKDKKVTVFNSVEDKNLQTKDAYEAELSSTINSLYKFSTTMSLGDISSSLKGGVGMLSKITGYISKAREIGEKVKSGNILDAVGNLAPGAKSAMQKMGMDPSIVDKIQAAAQMGVKAADTYKQIKSGNLNVLDGAQALAKSILGVELPVIKDIQAIQAAVTGIISEYSKAGIALKEEWKKLVQEWNPKTNSAEGNSWNMGTDIASTLLPELAKNGDYETMLAAIAHSDPLRMEKVSGDVISKMLKEYSNNTVFNRQRTPQENYTLIMKVIKAFRGGEFLWVDRNNPSRKGFNLKPFMDASQDFKKIATINLASKAYLKDSDTTGILHYNYTDDKNEVLLLLTSVFKQTTTNHDTELRKDFSEFMGNKTKPVKSLVTPSEFKANITI